MQQTNYITHIFLEATGSTKGKCSHGGKDDSSRTLVARCGINKDSVVDEYAPHSHLHKDAWSAVVTATENFLIANGKLFTKECKVCVILRPTF